MSLSKPVQHCPSNCRGCATFAAFGGTNFPPQLPGSPLAKCFEYALEAGIIGTSSNSASNEGLLPAPLFVPPKSAKRAVGRLLASAPSAADFMEEFQRQIVAAEAQVDGYEKILEGIVSEQLLQQRRAEYATRLKTPHINHATKPEQKFANTASSTSSASSSSETNLYEVKNCSFPLGHTYMPPGVLPLVNDPLFTVTTHGDRCATTFVGLYAMRMYDAFRASGVDTRVNEVRGEWEKVGVKRWMCSLGMDKDMSKVKTILGRRRDAVVAAEKENIGTYKLLKDYERMSRAVESRVDMEIAFRNVEQLVIDSQEEEESRQPLMDGPLNDEAMHRLIQEVLDLEFSPVDWDGPDWIGGAASIFYLPPRQRPWWGSDINSVVTNDSSDETPCTTYVRLAPPKPMGFSWYHRRNEEERDRAKYEWPQQVRWTMSDGVILEFSMDQVYGNLTHKFSVIRKHLVEQKAAADNTLMAIWSSWQNIAKGMNIFEWFWDEEKRILVKGYSGHNDYEKDCNWIDAELDNWKGSVEEWLEARNGVVNASNLTKEELRHTMIGDHLLRQWKEGPGIMVSKTPSNEKVEGSLLCAHTTDSASHINYLTARIADATRQRAKLERDWSFETATEDDYRAMKELIEHTEMLETLKFEIREQEIFEKRLRKVRSSRTKIREGS
ncbi:d4220618-daf0-42bb-ac2f-6984367ee71f-CDS [Sclerotinia trifoliorum]|uniref:D4220618-daf0-42bb-ac2f-6984367ee71f-CDS n=1 Tax=Sclerotinia trifoliorum TaxID=28548 RepID=A0A8H2VSV3_9HELO|nr:d4220618-daf0-42bb-ac2f-6984367ee71f-CDS [Sclerotinia trifoliorum]